MTMTSEAAWSDRTWRSRDGLNLHARVYGERSTSALPVVCIPGLTRNARDFEEVAPWIAAQGRQVFAVDLRGRAQSDRDPDPRRYQPRVYAQDMVALLESIGAPKAIFIGTSLGGLVTMALAASNPRVIGGAVINDVGPRVARAGLARIRSYAGKSAPVNTWDDAAAYAKSINGVAFPDAPDESWSVVARRLFKEEGGRPVLDYDPKIFRAPNPVVAWLAGPVLWSAFKRLGQAGPLLLLYGELTDVLDADTRQRMKQVAPNMVSVGVPRVGHAPWLSEPSAREAISTFLSKAP
jgi:pimeloyl-ACP methyl ester carboxylesterase